MYRTEVMSDLVADFYAYSGIHRRSSFLLQALDMGDKPMLEAFAKLSSLPATEVAQRCDDSGRTVLHHAAFRKDGKYNAMIGRAGVVDDMLVCHIDWNGNSAFDVGTSLPVAALICFLDL